MSTRKSIHTTGEHTIDNIIRSEYGNDLSPEEHIEKKKHLAKLNPHIVSLESLRVGDQVFLEDDQDQPWIPALPSADDQVVTDDQVDLSTLESGQFNVDEHKKKKK